MAKPTTRADLVMSTNNHCARLFLRAAHAPYSLPRLARLRRACLGANSRFQLDEALKLPSGIRRSSTPRASLEGADDEGKRKFSSFFLLVIILKASLKCFETNVIIAVAIVLPWLWRQKENKDKNYAYQYFVHSIPNGGQCAPPIVRGADGSHVPWYWVSVYAVRLYYDPYFLWTPSKWIRNRTD